MSLLLRLAQINQSKTQIEISNLPIAVPVDAWRRHAVNKYSTEHTISHDIFKDSLAISDFENIFLYAMPFWKKSQRILGSCSGTWELTLSSVTLQCVSNESMG